jgi:hypothetical protein
MKTAQLALLMALLLQIALSTYIYPTSCGSTSTTSTKISPTYSTCICTVSDSCFEKIEPVEGKEFAPELDVDELVRQSEFQNEVQKVAKAYEALGGSLDLLVQADTAADNVLAY